MIRGMQHTASVLSLVHKHKQYRDIQMIVGLDLAGNELEKLRENDVFHQTFIQAKSEGLSVTIHAGEATDANEIRSALKWGLADRIGHGYRSIYLAEGDNKDTAQEVLNIMKTNNIH